MQILFIIKRGFSKLYFFINELKDRMKFLTILGIIIMPFAISNIITKSTWIYGQTLCKIWCSMDVICCTASIITLCAISGDRFIGITKPLQYTQIVTRKRVAFTCLGTKFLLILPKPKGCSSYIFLMNCLSPRNSIDYISRAIKNKSVTSISNTEFRLIRG